jgi:hypothetical protein
VATKVHMILRRYVVLTYEEIKISHISVRGHFWDISVNALDSVF